MIQHFSVSQPLAPFLNDSSGGLEIVRIDNGFMDAVLKDGPWHLYWRTEKEKASAQNRAPKPRKTMRARDLWDQIAYAAWSGAERHSHSGTSCSAILMSRAGTPARRKYFCASTSAATCDHSAGTSMPFN